VTCLRFLSSILLTSLPGKDEGGTPHKDTLALSLALITEVLIRVILGSSL
jgi:hypothetical protein